jgi:hypothetical protein
MFSPKFPDQENSSHTLSADSLRVFENRVLERTFGPESDEMIKRRELFN